MAGFWQLSGIQLRPSRNNGFVASKSFPSLACKKMKYYQHKFEKVEHYLHHRAPYLLVEKIVSLDDKEIVTEKAISERDFWHKSHFPGAPIVPGAMMQELCTQSAGVLIAAQYNPMKQYDTSDPFANEFALGVLVKVRNARYRGFARPGNTLRCSVRLDDNLDNVFNFSGTISNGNEPIARLNFQLANIPSSVLQGISPQPATS